MIPQRPHLAALVVALASLGPGIPGPARADEPLVVASPDGRLRASVRLDDRGRPAFAIDRQGHPIASGTLGLDLIGSGPLDAGFRVLGESRTTVDATYPVPVGKTSAARDRHAELVVRLEEVAAPRRRLDLAFRAFDGGVAFRYQIPADGPVADFVLRDERTRLTLADAPRALALPLRDYTTSYEAYYKTLPVAAIGPKDLFGLPILLEPTAEGAAKNWGAVTEADLTDYAGMYLAGVEGEPGTLVSRLSPLPGRADGAKVVGRAPFASPWRVVQVADDPGRLIESDIVFHLNEPCRIADPAWIRPGKTAFPWWKGYAGPPGAPRAGVDTATMKHYIDFAAARGLPYHSLDGLDIAWYGGPIQPSGPTDITRAAPSIDMPELLAYAKAKGVRLRLWLHWQALKPQIDEAFRVYESWGIEGVMVDFMDRDDQEMVRFYHEMAAKAARHHLTVTLHGAYKPTGMERTWPNVLTSEGVLNQEYNKWEKPGQLGTPPRHNLDVAFVRMLAGPLDYHQGGMRSVLPENYRPRDKAPPVQGTRGHQLAMYVVYQNHLPMVADYPEAYDGQAGVDFIAAAPCTWDETRVLVAEVGRCLVIARRRGDAWYLGGMTADAGRDLALPLSFLQDGDYQAEVDLDRPGGAPTDLDRRMQAVRAGDKLGVAIPRAGGFVARLTPAAR